MTRLTATMTIHSGQRNRAAEKSWRPLLCFCLLLMTICNCQAFLVSSSTSSSRSRLRHEAAATTFRRSRESQGSYHPACRRISSESECCRRRTLRLQAGRPQQALSAHDGHNEQHQENNFQNDDDHIQQAAPYIDSISRRQVFGTGLSLVSSSALLIPLAANAEERRQLELCLVTVIRATYWAQSLVNRLAEAKTMGDVETQRQVYLEARLGSKTLLNSGKKNQVGPGVGAISGIPPIAARNLYMLSTLQLTPCLQDLQAVYNTQMTFSNTCRDYYESWASLVEFDGLDTLTDPSPRSQLFLQQWSDKKTVYVQRMLRERILPLGQQIQASFAAPARETSQTYVQRYYANEVVLAMTTSAETTNAPPTAVAAESSAASASVASSS